VRIILPLLINSTSEKKQKTAIMFEAENFTNCQGFRSTVF
jgi:hypothetical protein